MGISECDDLFPSIGSQQPWLMQSHGRPKYEQEFMNPYNQCILNRKIPQLKWKLCLGCFEGWLLLVDELTKETFFLHRNFDLKLKVCLPSLHGKTSEYLGGCVVSSSPLSRSCMVTFVGRTKDIIVYCRPNIDAKWTKLSLSINSQAHHRFTGQVVRYNRKIYAIHGSAVAHRIVVIHEDSLLTGDCTYTILLVPIAIYGMHHLVVWSHHLFLVSVANSNEGQGFPASCTIHHVELSDHTLKRVGSIGGCVFFLGGTQSSVLSPSQAGAQRDCIYIANQYYGEGIYKICMQDQTVSLSLLLNWPGRWRSQLFWLMPTRVYHSWTRKREIFSLNHAIGTHKSLVTHVHEEEMKKEECKVDISRPWADLPIELAELLLSRLYLMDCLRLPSVCKAWNSLSNLIQSSKVHPWFMYTTNDKSCLWRLFDPVYGKEYRIDMTWLGFSQDISFRYSKDGWLLVLKEDKYLFLINPLTRECIDLPEKDHCRFVGMSFSSSPTNSDCMVLVVSSYEHLFLEISTWRPGEDEWSNMIFYYRFCCPVPCNPVFTGGKFYYYPFRGKLSVYDPNKRTLQTFKTKAPLEIDENATKIMRGYLMESMGDLITVFRESPEDRLRIFKLDQQKMAWSELDDLGDFNIFLNHRTSLAKPFLDKKCPNPIYFSQFVDEHCKSMASYSLETNEWQPAERSALKEPTNCIWIEHSWRA